MSVVLLQNLLEILSTILSTRSLRETSCFDYKGKVSSVFATGMSSVRTLRFHNLQTRLFVMLLVSVIKAVSYDTVYVSLPFAVFSDFDKSVYSSTCIFELRLVFTLITI